MPRYRTTLGDCCEVQTGPFGSQLHASDYRESGTPIITVEHLGDNEVLHRNLPLVSDEDRTRLIRYSLQEGDIVFTRVGAIDRRAYASSSEHGWLFSGRLLRVRPNTSQLDGRFLSYSLGHPHAIQWIYNHAVGSTMACLNTAILSAVPVELPPLPEQRRIAEILDTLDKAIRKTEQIIAKLQQMKQGLLHDLLTRGIDEHGELRDPERHPEQFKDSPLGLIPRGWEVEPLGVVVPTAEYGVSLALHDAGKIPVLRMMNLAEGEADLADLKYSDSAKVRGLLLRPGDVLFNRTNSIDHVGRTGIWRGQLDSASFASYLVRLVPAPDRLIAEFLNRWLNWGTTQIRIRQWATPGVHQVNINPTNLRKTLIALPLSVAEQEHMSVVLVRHDERADAERIELNKLHALKHGLMDDLLTGRVRVKVPSEAVSLR